MQQKKSSSLSTGALCWHYLFSHAVTRILSSTVLSLTSVFGMGTGGPSGQSIPTCLRLAFAAHAVRRCGHASQDCILKTEHSFFRNYVFQRSFRACIVDNCQFSIVNCQLYRSSPRHISIGQLHTLPCFHLRPINVIVYDVPYSFRMGDLILGGVSRLDAFSVYLVQT